MKEFANKSSENREKQRQQFYEKYQESLNKGNANLRGESRIAPISEPSMMETISFKTTLKPSNTPSRFTSTPSSEMKQDAPWVDAEEESKISSTPQLLDV